MSYRVTNLIAECDDKKFRPVLPELRRGVMVHQFHVPGIHSMVGVANFFRMNHQYTGGQNAYTAGIWPSAEVEQALELGDHGPHGLAYSTPFLSLLVAGVDFDRVAPGHDQWERAVEVAADWCAWIGPKYELVGHDEKPGASKDPHKSCPGKYWPMDTFRSAVASRIASIMLTVEPPNVDFKLELRLLEKGFVL